MARKVKREDKLDTKEINTKTRAKYASSYGINQLSLKPRQQELIDVIDGNTITFVDGPAGASKTFTSLYYAVKNYLINPDEIIVVRTPVENNFDKVGFLPSELGLKIAPHFEANRAILETLVGKDKVEADLDKRIHFRVPNYMLGVTLENAVVIIEEAQMLQPLIMKLLLERTGQNCKVIVIGDSTQVYNKDTSRNGLRDAISRFFDEAGNPRYPNVAYFRFTEEDIVRSEIVKTVVRAYKDLC